MLLRKKDILMLGWEFPPAFTGGLGVACYNIVKTLSTQANIYLIVPFAGTQSDPEPFTISGINQIEQALGGEEPDSELKAFLLSRVSVALSAYPYSKAWALSKESEMTAEEKPFQTWKDVADYFDTNELYGQDILGRTHLFAKVARQLASRREFDFIYAHDWPTFQAAMELKKETNKPLILHVHSLETDRAGETTRNEIFDIEKKAMQYADKIIAVSDFTKQQIISHYEIDDHKIEIVHNGAEVSLPTHVRKNANEKWVTFAGRITFQKGPQFIVEMARKLIRVYPNVRFIIAGSGDLFASLIHEVAQKRLGKYFSFTGFLPHEKIKDLLSASDAYFMPSVSEPFGLAAVEAVKQGTASVISKRSGVSEILTHSLKADFWDTDRFANYLYAILKYPKLKKMIESQSQQDVSKLTWEKTAENIMKVYNTL